MAPTQNANESSPKNKTSLPPGMVMGPDGKPCKICTSFRNWKPGTTNYTEPDSTRPAKTWPSPKSDPPSGQGPAFVGFGALAGVPVASTAAGGAAITKESTTRHSPGDRADEPPPGCPPDVEQLGRATWTFLHTTAAYYPEKPTPAQRANMLMLLRSLPVLYPCTWCANDFGENIQKSPPDVSGRVALSRWLCQRHNEVNRKLGKENFDCAKVDERWKDGPPDGSCD